MPLTLVKCQTKTGINKMKIQQRKCISCTLSGEKSVFSIPFHTRQMAGCSRHIQVPYISSILRIERHTQ